MVTRRAFIGGALGSAAAMAVPLSGGYLTNPLLDHWARDRHAILDLGAQCSLPDAVAGYDVALDPWGSGVVHVAALSVPDCAMLIVPAALGLAASVARLVMQRLRDGGTVILESGAAFAPDDQPIFHDHRELLRDRLGIHTAPPIALWPRAARGIPYVDYAWPTPARVRDFSRVVPIDEDRTDAGIIARVDGIAVAARKRIGAGTLIFLGSPLGPALYAEDAEARRWLGEVVNAASRSRAASPSPG